jgi:hypothetical protein
MEDALHKHLSLLAGLVFAAGSALVADVATAQSSGSSSGDAMPSTSNSGESGPAMRRSGSGAWANCDPSQATGEDRGSSNAQADNAGSAADASGCSRAANSSTSDTKDDQDSGSSSAGSDSSQ